MSIPFAGSIADKTIRRLSEAQRGGSSAARALKGDDFHNLSKALALLYTHDRQFTKAIDIYIVIKDPEVFGIIGKYHQFNYVKNRIFELMEINSDLTIRLLLDNEDSVPPANVCGQARSQTPSHRGGNGTTEGEYPPSPPLATGLYVGIQV